jgi:hypothetical protein
LVLVPMVGTAALPAALLPSLDIAEECRLVLSAAFRPPTTENSTSSVFYRKLHFQSGTVLPFPSFHPFCRAHGWRYGS